MSINSGKMLALEAGKREGGVKWRYWWPKVLWVKGGVHCNTEIQS